MKKLIGLVAFVMVFAMLFVGCASTTTEEATEQTTVSASTEATTASSEETASSDTTIKIGYACASMNDTFQTYLVDAATDYAEANNAEIVVADAQLDVVKQQDQVEAFIQQGVQAIIITAADSSAMEPITEAAQAAGIPLVYANIYPFDDSENLPENVYYVGSKEIEAGIMQGNYIGELLNGEGSICILMGALTNEASYKRSDGVKQALEENYPNITVLAEEPGDWQRDTASTVTNNWITAYGDKMNAICSNNDEMAMGAVEALKAADISIPVMGVDAIPDALDAISSGEMVGTIFQDAVGIGSGATEMALKAINGETIENQIDWIPFVLITKDNVDEYK